MKISRGIRWIILLLMCSNIIILFLFLRAKQRQPHMPRLSHIVAAEGKQAQLLDTEMKRHQYCILKIRQSQFRIHQKLANSMPKDVQLRSKLLDELAINQRKIDATNLAHFDRVASLCNAKQREKFRAFQMRILEPHPRHQ